MSILKVDLMNNDATKEGSLDIDYFISILESAIISIFKEKHNIQRQNLAIDNFKEKIKSFSIVTVDLGKGRIWIRKPIQYFEEIQEHSFKERFFERIKNKSKLPKRSYRRSLSFDKAIQYPLRLTIRNSNDKNEYMKQEVEDLSLEYNDKFLFTLIHLHKNTLELKHSESCELISIYETPFAIIAMNNIKYYSEDLIKRISELNKKMDYSIPQSLKTEPLIDLIEKSIVEF